MTIQENNVYYPGYKSIQSERYVFSQRYIIVSRGQQLREMLKKSLPIIILAHKEAVNSRLLWILLPVGLLSMGVAELLSTIAITEKNAIQTGFIAGSIRWTTLFIVCLFTITSISRERENKFNDILFSLPISRGHYYLGKLIGYSAIALMVVGGLCLTLLFYIPLIDVFFWALSLSFELLIMVSFTLMVALSIHSIIGAFTMVLGFYLLARSADVLLLIANNNANIDPTLANKTIIVLLTGLSWLLPDFNAMVRIDDLLNNTTSSQNYLATGLAAAIYILFISFTSLIDLSRKHL